MHHSLYICLFTISMRSMNTPPDRRVLSFSALRKAVGWLGIGLPLAMLAGNFVFSSCHHLQDTISHYYYTVSGDLFVGILCAVALFLFAYPGYPGDSDKWWTTAAGFFALCIALFPTNDNSADSCAVIHLPDSNLRRSIHYISAGAFFLILAGISLFLFTRSSAQPNPKKQKRNRLYRTCGTIIFLCVLLIAVHGWWHGDEGWSRYKPVFWLEWIALLAFGTSWLVKGKLVLTDADATK